MITYFWEYSLAKLRLHLWSDSASFDKKRTAVNDCLRCFLPRYYNHSTNAILLIVSCVNFLRVDNEKNDVETKELSPSCNFGQVEALLNYPYKKLKNAHIKLREIPFQKSRRHAWRCSRNRARRVCKNVHWATTRSAIIHFWASNISARGKERGTKFLYQRFFQCFPVLQSLTVCTTGSQSDTFTLSSHPMPLHHHRLALYGIHGKPIDNVQYSILFYGRIYEQYLICAKKECLFTILRGLWQITAQANNQCLKTSDERVEQKFVWYTCFWIDDGEPRLEIHLAQMESNDLLTS